MYFLCKILKFFPCVCIYKCFVQNNSKYGCHFTFPNVFWLILRQSFHLLKLLTLNLHFFLLSPWKKCLLYSFHFHMTRFTWMRVSCPRSEGISALSGLVDFFILGLFCAITLAELRLGRKAWCVSWVGDSISSSRTFNFCQLHHSFSSPQVSKGCSLQLGLSWSQ